MDGGPDGCGMAGAASLSGAQSGVWPPEPDVLGWISAMELPLIIKGEVTGWMKDPFLKDGGMSDSEVDARFDRRMGAWMSS